MSEKHTKKVKKLKKKAKTHRHEGKPIPDPVQPPPFFHHEAEKRGHAPSNPLFIDSMTYNRWKYSSCPERKAKNSQEGGQT